MDHDMTNESVAINWSPGVTIEEIEKSVILKAYRFYRGNKTATAQSLGIAVRTLTNKLEGYKKDVMRQEQAVKQVEDEDREYALRARGEHPDQLREKFPEQYGETVYEPESLDSLGYTPTESADEENDFESGSYGDAEIDGDDDYFGAEESDLEDGEESFEVEDSDRDDDVQPAPKHSKKRTVSVPKRKKVQKVSSKSTSRLSLDGGRKGVRSRA